MPKIDLGEIWELDDHTIIKNQGELLDFVHSLDIKNHSPDSVRVMDLMEEFGEWLNWRKPHSVTFFSVFDDKDDIARNGRGGGYRLYRCIVIRTGDNKLHLFKNELRVFLH